MGGGGGGERVSKRLRQCTLNIIAMCKIDYGGGLGDNDLT